MKGVQAIANSMSSFGIGATKSGVTQDFEGRQLFYWQKSREIWNGHQLNGSDDKTRRKPGNGSY
jgi:hypothetical protein